MGLQLGYGYIVATLMTFIHFMNIFPFIGYLAIVFVAVLADAEIDITSVAQIM